MSLDGCVDGSTEILDLFKDALSVWSAVAGVGMSSINMAGSFSALEKIVARLRRALNVVSPASKCGRSDDGGRLRSETMSVAACLR